MKIHIRSGFKRVIWVGVLALFISALALFFIPREKVEVWVWLRCLNFGTGQVTGKLRLMAVRHFSLEAEDGIVRINRLHNNEADSKVIISALVAHLNDKNPEVARATVLSLGQIHQFPELVIPALLQAIQTDGNKDPNNPFYVPYALAAVGRFGTNAQPWSPVLLQMIQSNRLGSCGNDAMYVLAQIDPEKGEPMYYKYWYEYYDEISKRNAQTQAEEAEKQRKSQASSTHSPKGD